MAIGRKNIGKELTPFGKDTKKKGGKKKPFVPFGKKPKK